MYSMAKQTMTIRIDPDVRGALDSLAAAADRDRTWIVNQALTAYIETYQWQIEHIRQGVREANAGKFASAGEVENVLARLRRKRRFAGRPPHYAIWSPCTPILRQIAAQRQPRRWRRFWPGWNPCSAFREWDAKAVWRARASSSSRRSLSPTR